MSALKLNVSIILVMSAIVGYGIYVQHHITTIKATEQDIVRWCLDRRASHADAGSVKLYCKEMHGDEYIAKGFKPNYDKYPSYKMWGIKDEPKVEK